MSPRKIVPKKEVTQKQAAGEEIAVTASMTAVEDVQESEPIETPAPDDAPDYPAPPDDPEEPMEPGDIPAPAPLIVIVYKKTNDGMAQFFGEKVQTDPDGKEYFNLTQAAREAVKGNPNLVWPA